jgi:hypothetical protein
MNKNTFKDDYNIGRVHEIEARRRILQIYNNFKIGNEQDETNYKYINYDFQIIEPSNIFSLQFEVKYDRLVNYTNNYFIEFQNNNSIYVN